MNIRLWPDRTVTLLRCAPLAVMLAIVWRVLPVLTERVPVRAWPLPMQLDPLSLCILLAISLAVAAAPLDHGATLRACLGIALIAPALVLLHVLMLPVALLLVALLVRRPHLTLSALALLAAAVWLRMAGVRAWTAPAIGGLATTPFWLLLALGAIVALLAVSDDSPVAMLFVPAFLVPLLRSLTWVPWQPLWSATIVGAGLLLLTLAVLPRTPQPYTQLALALAIVALGLASTVGTLALLWLLLTGGLIAAFEQRGNTCGALLLLLPGAWLAIGALGAAGAWLPGAGTLLLVLALLAPQRHARSSHDLRWLFAIVLLGVGMPLVCARLLMPAVDQLQAGLSPFGLVSVWPWIGLAALNSGQRRIVTLPTVALPLLYAVQFAIVWLLARVSGIIAPPQPGNDEPQSDATIWWWPVPHE